MRIIGFIVVCLLGSTAACIEQPVETSEVGSDLTFYSPRLAIVARIASRRATADDLRASAAASKPSLYSPWTTLQEYKTLAQSGYDSADMLDSAADALEAKLATTSDVDSLDEMSEMESLKLQMVMDRMVKADAAASAAMKKFQDTLVQIISNFK